MPRFPYAYDFTSTGRCPFNLSQVAAYSWLEVSRSRKSCADSIAVGSTLI